MVSEKDEVNFLCGLFRKEYCPRKTWSISPTGVVQVYLSKKPQSVFPAVLFVRGAVRENQSQFSRRENCSLALALTLFDFFKIEKPCPFELRDIFLNSTPYSLGFFCQKSMPAQSPRHFSLSSTPLLLIQGNNIFNLQFPTCNLQLDTKKCRISL